MDHLSEISERRSSTRILLTAAEAYPALEEAFLDAQTRIVASFAVFNLSTLLRSGRARAVGRTWAELITHTLARGVAITLTIADFDPLAQTAAHRASWSSVRQLNAAAAIVPGAKLTVDAISHDAETGILPRLGFWPLVVRNQMRVARWLNGQTDGDRSAALADLPGLASCLVKRRNGALRPSLWPVPRHCPGLHHQKLAVFDGTLLYIGGIDLDDRPISAPDQEQWHDVQLLLQGPVVAEAEEHLAGFLGVVSGKTKPPITRRLLRTVSRKRARNMTFYGPEPVVQDIAAGHEAMIRRSRQLIYLETQYFYDGNLIRKLEQAGRDTPGLSVILILPTDDMGFDGKRTLGARWSEYRQARVIKR